MIIENICGGFIHLFPSYRKSWGKVKEFVKEYDKEDYTYKQHFIQNTQLGIFFNNGRHYPKGFFQKLWYYWGSKNGWLVEYKRCVDESIENSKKMLEECFTPRLKKMLEKQNEKGLL